MLRVRGRESRGRGGGRGRVRAVRGSCVATFRTSRRRGGGQAGRCRGGTTVRTRRPHAPGLLAGGGGRLALASRLGRPAGPHRGGEAQVSPSFLVFLFSNFSDICFDLINILNHLILLCQFLQERDILFQSSFINGIIFGPYFIYIEIYFQCKYLSN